MQPMFLTIEDVLKLHKKQIELFGGSDGIRDINLLESAIAMPQAGFGNEYLHKDLYEMASAYLFHISQNHPFIDGNKRTSLDAAIIFLYLNGIQVESSDDELYSFALNVAQGKSTKEDITEFFLKNSIRNLKTTCD